MKNYINFIVNSFNYKFNKKSRNNNNMYNHTIHYGASGLLMCLTFYCIMKFPKSKIGFQTVFIPAWIAGFLMIL